MTAIIFGSISLDLNLRVNKHPIPGETLLGTGGTYSPGGKGANQALACAMSGVPTKMLGAIGNDHHSTQAISLLEKYQVNLNDIQHLEGPTGLAIITVAQDGENTVIVVPGANHKLQADNLKWVEDQLKLADSKILVMQAEIPKSCIAEAAKYAKENNVRLVFSLAPAVDVDPDVLLQANPLLVNEHEALKALQILIENSDKSEMDLSSISNNAEQLATHLLAEGVPSVVITLGKKGALVGENQSVHSEESVANLELIPAEKIEAVDTVGAGDAFAGALVAGLHADLDLSTAARKATKFAAATVKYPGAQASYPHAQLEMETEE